MAISDSKSRPTWRALAFDPSGRYHLLVGQGSGGEALLRLLATIPPGAAVHVLYTAGSLPGNDWSDRLRACAPAEVGLFATQAEVLASLDRTLSVCRMGTRLYLAGPESFLGLAVQVAMKHGLRDEVQGEPHGSSARRVFCIHCKAFNEDVRTNIVRCGGCGRHLLVRDHYSRRLAAFMGIMADAEVPGELPPIREVFP